MYRLNIVAIALSTLAGAIATSAPAAAQLPDINLGKIIRPQDLLPKPHPPSLSTLPVERFKAGRVIVTNGYEGLVTVVVYHPAQPTVPFKQYQVAGNNARSYLGDASMNLGEDWGIQVHFPNGVKSPVKRLDQVAGFNGDFHLKATDLMK